MPGASIYAESQPDPVKGREAVGLDQLSIPLVVTDDQLKLLYLNGPAREIVGFGREQGCHISEMGALGQALTATAEKAVSQQKSITERSAASVQGDRQDYFDAIFSPFSGPDNELRLLIELIPISFRWQMDQSQKEIWQHAARERLARGLAHEIKNPMGGLRGAAQLLQRSLDDPELREYTDVIISEVDRLVRLVDRLQSQNSPSDHREFNAHRALERVRQLIVAQYPNLSLKRDYDPSLPQVRGDLDRLVQGILNLAINAVQAGATKLEFRTRIKRGVTFGDVSHRSVIAIEVVDNGPGVPDEISELVFYPLISGRSNGSGMGLAIAQSIAIEHGGVIRLGRENGFTVFEWLLPLEHSA